MRTRRHWPVARIAGLLLAAMSLVIAGQTAAGPRIESWSSSQGARVYLVRAPELPIIDIRVVFDAGSARDGANPGIAALTSAVIGEGAGGVGAIEFSERMAATGARFSRNALRDMAWLSLRSLTENTSLTPAAALFGKALSAPNFDEDAVARQRERTLAAIDRSEESPADIGEKALFAAIYGDHPYASPMDGTAASVSALDADALRRFHREFYVARNAVIAIVGDVSVRQARRLVDELLANLPAGRRADPLPVVGDIEASKSIRIAHPSMQSHFLLGQPGIARTDPDYFALVVGNHVLGGGGLVSILFDEIREKRGLSYSASSYFSPMAVRGPFIAGLQTDSAQENEARAVLVETLRAFINEGPTEAQLVAAKRNIIGGFPLRIDSNANIIEYIAMIGFYDLPLDFLDTYSDHVEALTRAQIQEALKRRLDIDRMVMVTVGADD